MNLYNRIRERRIALGMSQGELAKLLGYTNRSTITKIEKGVNDITQSKIEAFATALKTTPGYLMGWTDDPSPEHAIPSNVIPMPEMHKIPLVGDIACGTPILAVENVEDNIFAPDDIRADFALRCKGDSMIGADIQEGDIVYIKEQDEVLDGQIAAVLIEDEATLKRVYYDKAQQMITLIAENPLIPPRIYQGEALDHIRVLGLAVGLTRKI